MNYFKADDCFYNLVFYLKTMESIKNIDDLDQRVALCNFWLNSYHNELIKDIKRHGKQ